MTAKKSFSIILKIYFVMFSLRFIKDALYKWDGYSYYMTFAAFLPDLALSYVLWSLFGLISAVVFWIIAYGVPKLYPKNRINICFEHIAAWFCLFLLIAIIITFLKTTFFGSVLISSIGLSRYSILVIVFVLTMPAAWVINRYIPAEKLLSMFTDRITPLVWIFAIVFIISIPLSMYNNNGVEGNAPRNVVEFSPGSGQERPNIILVVMDTLTATDMQVYGYNRPTTPFISEWAGESVLFDNAYASSNWTTPATMTIMTGQRPWTHGIWYRAELNNVSRYKNNVARVLGEHGYDLYSYVQNNHAHPETLGLKDYFSRKDSPNTFWIPNEWWVSSLTKFYFNRRIAAEWIIAGNPIFKPLKSMYFHWPIFSSTVLSETVYDRFINDISHKQDKPFFAWIQVYPPHDLFLPPEPYMGVFGDKERFDTAKEQLDSKLLYKYYSADEQKDIDILRKRYDEFILYADQRFKVFISQLNETIDMSNTIVILTSDHGESFSHGYSSHDGPHLYEPLVHVPLMIRMPAGSPMSGKRVEIKVDQSDIAPTILELADIAVPKWMDGRSLLPLINGGTMDEQPVFSMQLIKNRSLDNKLITEGTLAVWKGEYKLIHYLDEDRSLLFDLTQDPDELNNIISEEPGVGMELLSIIKENLETANEKIVGGEE